MCGFTLVEIIIGLILSALAISMVATLIYPLFARSVEPMLQIRAAEFAQTLIDDAMSRRYDENTPLGGQPVCNPCTAPGSLGADGGESSRDLFNDFDDYSLFCSGGPYDIQNVLGDILNAADEYRNFSFTACVVYDGNYDGGGDDGNIAAKRIDVTVFPPSPAANVVVSAYRANY